MRRSKKRSQAGQVAIEYVFLLVVIISIMLGLLPQIRSFFFGDGRPCHAASKSLVCVVKGRITPGSFRYFSILGR